MHVDDLSNAIRKIINLLMNNNMKLNQLIKKYSFINIGWVRITQLNSMQQSYENN